MKRFTKLDDLTLALKKLKAGLAEVKNDLDRDGVIQRFEFTFELLWKVLQEYAMFEGLEAASPREAFRIAADVGLIDDPVPWFEFLKNRNRTTHLYDEKEAREVLSHLPSFVNAVEALLAVLHSALK